MAKRLKTLDELLVIAEGEVVTTTASCTPVQIDGLAVGSNDLACLVNTNVPTGVVDGSNYYSLQLEVSDALGGTYVAVGGPVDSPAEGGTRQIGLTAEEMGDKVPGANFYRVTATKVGTTATAVTYTAQMTKV